MNTIKPRIMVVDDEEVIRDCMASYFSRRDYIVSAVESAETALLMIHRESPHLIILDICLPGMSGIELMALVRQFNHSAKVVVISGYDLELLKESQLNRLDIYKFLKKPASLSEIEDIINKAMKEFEAERQR